MSACYTCDDRGYYFANGEEYACGLCEAGAAYAGLGHDYSSDDTGDWPVPMAELRAATVQAQFEELREKWGALVATLPLPVRIWARHVGPYGIRFAAIFRRKS